MYQYPDLKFKRYTFSKPHLKASLKKKIYLNTVNVL